MARPKAVLSAYEHLQLRDRPSLKKKGNFNIKPEGPQAVATS